jgi:hypothetical protein
MTETFLVTRLFRDTTMADTSRSRLLELLRRSDFSGQRKNWELLPLNAADSLCSRPLTKTEEKDTITSTAQADPLIPKRILSKQAEPPLWLSRRSSKSYVKWARYARMLERFALPPPRIVHAYAVA